MNVKQERYTRIIAEFLNIKIKDISKDWCVGEGKALADITTMSGMYPQSQIMLEHFRFHLSYDWLHRAYIDFKDLRFVNTIDQTTHESKCFVFREYFTNKDINIAFEHLAESIEWSNSKRVQNSNQIFSEHTHQL